MEELVGKIQESLKKGTFLFSLVTFLSVCFADFDGVIVSVQLQTPAVVEE